MEKTDKKIHVAIASKQFIYRLGIKTILSVLGIEPELTETDSAKKIKSLFKKGNDVDFIIMCDDLIPSLHNKFLKEIKQMFPKGKLMIIGEKVINDCPCSHFVLNSHTRKEVLEIFQDFFFEPEPNDLEDINEDKALLSEREIDVLKTVASGYSNKEIADKLCISINTVITHRKNITEKLGIKTIAGLTVYAMMNNYITPEEVRS